VCTCFCSHPLIITLEFCPLEAAGVLMDRDLPLDFRDPFEIGLCGGVLSGGFMTGCPEIGCSKVVMCLL